MTYDQAVRAWLDSIPRDDLEELARDYRRGDTDAAAVDAHREVMRLSGPVADAFVMDEWRSALTENECRQYHSRWRAGERDKWVRAGEREYQVRHKRRQGAA